MTRDVQSKHDDSARRDEHAIFVVEVFLRTQCVVLFSCPLSRGGVQYHSLPLGWWQFRVPSQLSHNYERCVMHYGGGWNEARHSDAMIAYSIQRISRNSGSAKCRKSTPGRDTQDANSEFTAP
ncbi:hypothetical protein PAXRUDRAFT_824328 [Paxillus rubicundulus Ve08.2h10]|uniref:Uncharacterized protein n=1 Tax=Paxillus rubicundulus Ve08.2h10 TaxID=930991 RepID=A0A0D0DUK2_9AGAM|nr:hypothetical protein PAXRUDRAFT_824328 [Paxillus rubicundulus Ve08.2h10]